MPHSGKYDSVEELCWAAFSCVVSSVPCPKPRVRHRTAASKSSRILQPDPDPGAFVRAGRSGVSCAASEAGERPSALDFNHCGGSRDEVTAIRVQSAPWRFGAGPARGETLGVAFAQCRWNRLGPCSTGARAAAGWSWNGAARGC